MAMGFSKKKLEVFKIQAHVGEHALEDQYQALFEAIAGLPREERIKLYRERVLAMPYIDIGKRYITFTVYDGELEIPPLIFNTMTSNERFETLRKGEAVVSKTHGGIDLKSREVIVEYNHRGAKASDIADLIQDVASSLENYKDLTLNFVPLPTASFTEAINRFERIRLASLRVVRPNMDWTPELNNITKLASDSQARSIEVSMSAQKGRSLAVNNGIIRLLKQIADAVELIVKGAKVTGTRRGEKTETTVSLKNHIEHLKVSVKKTNGQIDEGDIFQEITDFLNSRLKQKP